jgi:hypothetical protein
MRQLNGGDNMKKYMIHIVLILCLSGGCTENAEQSATERSGNDSAIAGTWILVQRELPDGTIIRPPDIMGLTTYRDGCRNFNITMKDSAGKQLSISVASTYNLTENEYHEQPLFVIRAFEEQPTNYDLSPASVNAPITKENGRLEFDLGPTEPVLVYEGNKFSAIGEGFVDRWELVK